METASEKSLIEKIRQLPPQRLAEVEDFVDFLRYRYTDEALVRSAAKLSQPSFAAVWVNEEDAAYDKL